MKVAMLYDQANADGTRGGAELTMDEFKACAPDSVEFTDRRAADVIVFGNCVTFPPLAHGLAGKRVIRYHHDLARHESPLLRGWLDEHAIHVYTSPLHRELYAGPDGPCVPPAIDLDRFRPSRQVRRNTRREGAVSIASWQNPGKGAHLVGEFAAANDLVVDCYGTGAFVPYGPSVEFHGPLEPPEVPQVLHRYERFVFLPTDPEPFGRCVVEAWAAGLKLVVNRLVGCRYWLEEDRDALGSAGEDFWRLVLDA